MEDKELEPRPPSRWSPSPQHPTSRNSSASSFDDKDAVENVASEQPQSTQWTLPPDPRGPKGKSSQAAHLWTVHFTWRFAAVPCRTNYFADGDIVTAVTVFDNTKEGASPQHDVTETEMFVFLALTLQMGHTIRG
jgi:hypothetical protein